MCITLVAVTFAIGTFLGISLIKPPSANEDSPTFQHMMSNIQKLAVEPHIAGSAEIDVVRAQLLSEIEGMGLSPIIEDVVYTEDEIIDAWMRWDNTTLGGWD